MTELFIRKTWGPIHSDIVKTMELYNPDPSWHRTNDEWPQEVAQR